MFRGITMLFCVVFSVILAAEEPVAPEKPDGISLTEHGTLNLSLETGVWYLSPDFAGDDVPPREDAAVFPVIPAFTFRYSDLDNEFSWAVRGLVGYSLVDGVSSEKVIGSFATKMEGRFLKRSPVSFGFSAGIQLDIFDRDVHGFFFYDLFASRTALHSFWGRQDVFANIRIPVGLFVEGTDGAFSASLSSGTQYLFRDSGETVMPLNASVSVRLLPRLDLSYDGGVTVTSDDREQPLAIRQLAGLSFRFSPLVTGRVLAGYAGMQSPDRSLRREWSHHAAFDVMLDMKNAVATNRTVIGFRRMPLPPYDGGGKECILADDLYLNFEDRSVFPWLLLAFDGDVAYAEIAPHEPGMFIRFVPRIAATFWDILTWQITGGVMFLKEWKGDERGYLDNRIQFVETTVTITY